MLIFKEKGNIANFPKYKALTYGDILFEINFSDRKEKIIIILPFENVFNFYLYFAVCQKWSAMFFLNNTLLSSVLIIRFIYLFIFYCSSYLYLFFCFNLKWKNKTKIIADFFTTEETGQKLNLTE